MRKLFFQKCTIVFFSFIGLSNFVWAEDATSLKKLSDKDLEILDNTPSTCPGMSKLDNGETIEHVIKNTNDPKVKGEFKPSIAYMKAEEERQHEAKSVREIDGTPSTGRPQIRRFVLNAPVDLWESPNGKRVGIFQKDFVVLLEGQKGEWAFIRGYWDRPCDTGWIEKKWLSPYLPK